MKAAEWIDRVRAARGLESDYAAAKALGVSRQAVSDYRNKGNTLDESACLRVAEALGVDAEVVLVDQVRERSKSEAARAALAQALRRLGGVAASILLATGLGGIPNADARLAQHSKTSSSTTVYTSSKPKRRRKARPFDGLMALAIA